MGIGRIGLWGILLYPGLAPGGDGPKVLETGVSIIEQWDRDQHLYVTGELGIGEKQLAGLEEWLDENGPNWTVLLMESSRGEVYTDAQGRRHRGLDAVEYCLGQGLPAKTDFGQLRDAATREANGAFFILFLKDRKFSYSAMELYEKRGLGARNWAGNLDRAAIKAMRNGGRVVDAAKGTVTLVDGKLKQHFVRLKAAKEQEIERASRIRAQAGKSIADARRTLQQAVEKRRRIGEGMWSLEGSVFDLDEEGMKRELQEAEGYLKDEPSGAYLVEPKVRSIRSRIASWHAGVDQFLRDENRLKALRDEISIATFQSVEARKLQKAAGMVMDESLEFYRGGERQYVSSFEQARRLMRGAVNEDRRFHKHRANVITGGLVGFGFLGLVGFWGNRSRRRIKKEAETLLEARKEEMEEIVDRLFGVMDRASVVVGAEDELEKRGYEGETLNLSRKALSRIDEAFVLSSHVQRIVGEAEILMNAKSPWRWSRNLVSGGLYARAVDLLDDEVVCKPNEGSVLVSEMKGEERVRLAAADGDFSVPIDAWKMKTEEALGEVTVCLDEVDGAWSTIISRCEDLNKGIGRLEEVEVDFEGGEDAYLRCGFLFAGWLDAMEVAYDRGVALGASDPVLALRDFVSPGDRMVMEANRLLEAVSTFRKERWKALMQGREALKSRRRKVAWIAEHLVRFSDEVDELAEMGVKEPVLDWIEGFKVRLHELSDDVGTCVAMAKRADEDCLPDIKAGEAGVGKARRELAQALTLPGDAVLHEEGNDPGLGLEQARKLLAEGLGFLDGGRIEEAEFSFDQLDEQVARANHLVSDSREVFESFGTWFDALGKQRRSLDDSCEKMRGDVVGMRARYAPRALFVDPREDEDGGYAGAPQIVDEFLAQIAQRLEHSKERFKSGAMLDAKRLIIEGRRLDADGVELCVEVTTRKDLLQKMERDNESNLVQRESELVDMKPSVEDRRVMRVTLRLFQETRELLQQGREALEAGDGLRNPFAVEDLLAEVVARISGVRTGVASDLEHYEAVSKHYALVTNSQESALGLSHQAQTDRIADSEETTRCLGRIERLGLRLDEAKVTLNGEHEDWGALEESLREIHMEISEAIISLTKELEKAREALRVLKSAIAEVRRAENWSGSYGVRIGLFSGDDYLISANQAMMKGQYERAMRASGQARSSARSAVAAAESEVASRRRAAEREARRRRRAAARSRMRSSSFSSASSSSSSSSFRSSSSGRSSFSSGSGVGRSGW